MGSASVWDERTRALRTRPPAGQLEAAEAPPLGHALPLALSAEELAALVSGIVEVTLDRRFTGHEPARRAELARELEIRLLALLGAAPQPETAAEAREVEPATASGSVGSEAPGVALAGLAPGDQPLGQALEQRLQRLGGALAARSDLRARLIALALEHRASSPAGEASGASGEELRGLDVLQRRAAKLERSLQETRATLAYVSGLEHVDPGIASIHREVQGLSLADPQRERKRVALECLFRSNLALQKPERPDGVDQRSV